MDNKLNSIEALANEIIFEVNRIKEELNGVPFENFQARIEDNKIICTWTANSTGEMDIEYYAVGINRLWQHSVRKYGHELNIEDEEFSITIGMEAVWSLKAVTENHVEQAVVSNVKKEEEEEEPEE